MKEETDIRNKIVLAAMLHDIGKFWQRADDYLNLSSRMKEYSSGDNANIVPTFDGKPGYQHALWTHRFIMDHKSVFNCIIDDFNAEELALLAAKHHRPDENNIAQAIISIADKWSSKNERVFADYGESDDPERSYEHKSWGSFAYKKIPLHNIFDVVNRPENFELKEEYRYGYKLRPLEVLGNPTIFSEKVKVDKDADLSDDYAALWNKFNKEFSELSGKVKSLKQAIVAIDALLLKYTWCIPSSTMDMPYASLYQHSKMVAGLSLSLYDYYQIFPKDFVGDNTFEGRYGWQFKLGEKSGDPLIILCLDLSGIQKYIYDISSRYAAKSLKGRSYSLQLLMKSCINEILFHDDIQANLNHVIYSSGGKAYLILPNTKKCTDALGFIRDRLEEKFFATYGLGLYPAMGWVSFRYQIKYETGSYKMELHSNDNNFKEFEKKEDSEKNLGELWRSVSDEAARWKSRKYEKMIIKKYDYFFDPQAINNVTNDNLPKCAITGVREENMEKLNKDVDDASEIEVYVSKAVHDQIKLGADLKKAESISEYYNENNSTNHSYKPADLSTTFVINPAVERIDKDMTTYSYNEFSPDYHGMLFYGGNKQPMNEGIETITFNEMCLVNVKKESYTNLGVLKMDVDNLGKLFIRGLPDKDKSFSAYATLSFFLEAFFSGFINELRNNDEYKNYVQIIYSGGDDVFAVGRWDKLIEFARELNQWFHQLTARDEITLSGGMAMVRPKFPISKAADMADEAESASKNYNHDEKNAFNFFGETVGWDSEMGEVIKLKDTLKEYVKNCDISYGFLHKLQSYKVVKDEAEKSEKKDFSYKWHSTYLIARMLEPLRKNKEKNEEVKTFLEDMQIRLMKEDRYLDLLGLAARWTEYLLKIKNMENEKI